MQMQVLRPNIYAPAKPICRIVFNANSLETIAKNAIFHTILMPAIYVLRAIRCFQTVLIAQCQSVMNVNHRILFSTQRNVEHHPTTQTRL